MVQLTLNAILPRITKESVVHMSDNLKKQGSTVSRVMCNLAQEILGQLDLHLLTRGTYHGRRMSWQIN